MIDFILKVLSNIVQVNLRDVHEVPLAMPLMLFPFLGFVISMIVLRFIGNETNEHE